MDSVMAAYTTDQSIAPYQQIKIKTPNKKAARAFVSKPSSENFDIYGGILHPHPPSLSFSVINHHYRQNQQPPLLPLPISAVPQSLLSRSLSQGFSCLPSSRRNRTRDLSLTPKKSKPTKREEVKRDLSSATRSISELLIVPSGNLLGPAPNDLPKKLPVVLSRPSGKGFGTVSTGNIETLSDSVFNLSPPPSSLPLPKFCVRPKLGCNAKAAGIDTGATDNLQRLLRLR